MEGISLISTLAIGFGVALVLGFLAEKLKVPALVGYLLAGILVSPSVFGFDVDLNLANQLAEIGIMLLMFGVGLHFSLTDLLKVKGLVVPGAICQMLLSALIGFGLSWLWGWDVGHQFFSAAVYPVLPRSLFSKPWRQEACSRASTAT